MDGPNASTVPLVALATLVAAESSSNHSLSAPSHSAPLAKPSTTVALAWPPKRCNITKHGPMMTFTPCAYCRACRGRHVQGGCGGTGTGVQR